MIDVLVSIYLASKTRWAHLQKTVVMPAVPRVGEWLKLHNEEQGDYFGFRVYEVTHREGGSVELMTELLDDVGGRGYSFAEEPEFDDYYRSYLACGWQGQVKANHRLGHITSAADAAVEVRLSQSEALVLFDLLSRFSEPGRLAVDDRAEERVLWNVCCSLEKDLVEPLRPDYADVLRRARDQLRGD